MAEVLSNEFVVVWTRIGSVEEADIGASAQQGDSASISAVGEDRLWLMLHAELLAGDLPTEGGMLLSLRSITSVGS